MINSQKQKTQSSMRTCPISLSQTTGVQNGLWWIPINFVVNHIRTVQHPWLSSSRIKNIPNVSFIALRIKGTYPNKISWILSYDIPVKSRKMLEALHPGWIISRLSHLKRSTILGIAFPIRFPAFHYKIGSSNHQSRWGCQFLLNKNTY